MFQWISENFGKLKNQVKKRHLAPLLTPTLIMLRDRLPKTFKEGSENPENSQLSPFLLLQ